LQFSTVFQFLSKNFKERPKFKKQTPNLQEKVEKNEQIEKEEIEEIKEITNLKDQIEKKQSKPTSHLFELFS
jgi:hypothetical protein